jgi:uncharacterized membrane protein (DUF485 family)
VASTGSRDPRPGTANDAGVRHRQSAMLITLRGENMADATQMDWKAIVADPRFQALHRKKTAFLWGLMVFSVVYYFLLPIGAAYFQDLFKIKVFGPVNVGILFALSEFLVAWGIAFYYARKANAEFDTAAAEIARDVEKQYGGKK